MLNLINLDGFEAFKRQTPGTWLEICVNHFEFDVIWRTSQLLLKLHSHNSVLWRFCNISVLPEFSYLGVGLKIKTQKSRKIFILLGFFSQTLSNLLLCFSFFIFMARIFNFLVQLLFPWFPWFPRFPGFRPGGVDHIYQDFYQVLNTSWILELKVYSSLAITWKQWYQ